MSNFVKHFNHFTASTSLHTVSHYLPLSEFCGQISENIFFLDLLVQKLFFDKNYWFQLLSTKNNWVISLFLMSIILQIMSISQPFHHVFCWRRNKLWLWMKTLLLLLTKSPNTRKFFSRFVFCLSFVFFSFSFFGLLRPQLQICRVWLTQIQQNVLNKSPKVTNISIISFGRKATWFTTA